MSSLPQHEPEGPNLLDLPVELLETLILCPSLSIRDICALCRVCWTLNHVVSRIWAKIAKSRWKYWGKTISADGKEGGLDWNQLCRHRYVCEISTRKIIDELTKKGMTIVHMSRDELDCFDEFLKESKCPPDILMCTLDSILHQDEKEANLTHQYYALYGKEYITWMALAENWQELLSQQDDPQLLEKGAVLLSQWMNPCKEISAVSVHRQLDGIAEQVTAELQQYQNDGDGEEELEAKSSPASDDSEEMDTSRSEVDQSTKGHDTIAGDGTSGEMVILSGGLQLPIKVVLDGINTVLYSRLHFSAPSMQQYYNLENSFIDKVLAQKKGLPITMCIIYQAVARRLGVTLRTINFPSHFLLQIPPEPGREYNGSEPVFIDAFSRGVRRSYVECCSMINRPVPEVEVADPMEVFMRMTTNIYTQSHIFAMQNLDREFDKELNQWGPVPMTAALNLQLVLCSLAEMRPHSTVLHRALHLIYTCLDLNYALKKVNQIAARLKEFEVTLENQQLDRLVQRASVLYSEKQKSFEEPITPMQRSPGLMYRVGMIMKHRRYDYRCVIYGWDITCKMNDLWIARMGVDRLPNGRNQPFYNVLVEDGSNRYAAEENLFPCPPNELTSIEHWEIGRFFTSYGGDDYVPNSTLKQAYPYD